MDKIDAHSKVYLDSNILIYRTEPSHAFFEQVSQLFDFLETVGAQLLTSEISQSECLEKPIKDQDQSLIAAYKNLFGDQRKIKIVPLSIEMSNEAAKLSSQWGLKLADAIHYLSAQKASCNYFVTSDKAFKSDDQITVIKIRKQDSFNA